MNAERTVKLYDGSAPHAIYDNNEIRATMGESFPNGDRSYPVTFNVTVERWTSTDALGTPRYEHVASFAFLQAADGRVIRQSLHNIGPLSEALGSLVSGMVTDFLEAVSE